MIAVGFFLILLGALEGLYASCPSPGAQAPQSPKATIRSECAPRKARNEELNQKGFYPLPSVATLGKFCQWLIQRGSRGLVPALCERRHGPFISASKAFRKTIRSRRPHLSCTPNASLRCAITPSATLHTSHKIRDAYRGPSYSRLQYPYLSMGTH